MVWFIRIMPFLLTNKQERHYRLQGSEAYETTKNDEITALYKLEQDFENNKNSILKISIDKWLIRY